MATMTALLPNSTRQAQGWCFPHSSSPGFPATPGAYRTTYHNASFNTVDGFVVKLNATGTGLLYATFLGGEKDDESRAVAVDSTGNAVVVGATTSRSFPASANAFQQNFNGNRDAFVMQFNA